MGARLKEKLAQGKLLNVFGMGQLCYPKYVEIIGAAGGYDGIWLDHEHAGISIEQIESAARAARGAGLSTFVRLAATDYASVMRPLEAGAGGIMAAQVRSAAQAEEIVRWAKFHPRGLRGFNGCGIDGVFASLPAQEYIRRANASTFIAIQIEHYEAVEDVEKIAAVPDVDILFIGPADLSQSMGIPGQWEDPRVWQSIERVAKAAQKSGIHWAILPRGPEHARRCVELGCRMLSTGLDVRVLFRGLQAYQAEYADLFGARNPG